MRCVEHQTNEARELAHELALTNEELRAVISEAKKAWAAADAANRSIERRAPVQWWLVHLPLDAELAPDPVEPGRREIVLAGQRIGRKAVLGHKARLALFHHTRTAGRITVHGRVENDQGTPRARDAQRLLCGLDVVGRVVKRRVEDRQVDARRRQRQAVELGEDRAHRNGVVAYGAKPVQRVGEQVESGHPVPAQRQAIGEPAAARADVEDLQRPRIVALERLQHTLHKHLVRPGADPPDG